MSNQIHDIKYKSVLLEFIFKCIPARNYRQNTFVLVTITNFLKLVLPVSLSFFASSYKTIVKTNIHYIPNRTDIGKWRKISLLNLKCLWIEVETNISLYSEKSFKTFLWVMNKLLNLNNQGSIERKHYLCKADSK